ncbi:MAG: hypothetical protein JO181_10825, partial [Solirubrobacterales bacterium]|nr:hypothetical protein [Solirubrobacterales bacterium]
AEDPERHNQHRANKPALSGSGQEARSAPDRCLALPAHHFSASLTVAAHTLALPCSPYSPFGPGQTGAATNLQAARGKTTAALSGEATRT